MTSSPIRPATEPSEPKKLRYAGKCRVCGIDLPARTLAFHDRSTQTVRCVECPAAPPAPHELRVAIEPAPHPSAEPAPHPTATSSPQPPADVPNVAGASARREYERRKANDQARLRKRFGPLGGLAVALASDRQTTRAWKQGADGEAKLGARLDSLATHGITALHDRRVPRSKANIDHLVITRGGVWVVDAKQYKGRPQLIPRRTADGPRVTLTVGKRDCTSLVDGALWQAQIVREALPDVPVSAALCFVGADWPLIGAFFGIQGVHVVSPRQLSKLLRADRHGSLDTSAACRVLEAHFKPA